MNQATGILRDLAQLLIPAATQRAINLSPERQQCIDALLHELSIRALSAFQEHRLSCFDALVGDTSCQLRAVKILSLHAEMQKSEEMKRHLQSLLMTLRHEREMDSEKLTEDDKYLILSYMLHFTRDKHMRRRTNSLNLGELADIKCLLGITIATTPLIDKIVFQAKTVLANRSIEVLIQEAGDLSVAGEEKKALVNIAKKCSVIGGAGVVTTPCFYNLQILLENVRARGTPLILVIHRIAIKAQLKLAFHSRDKLTFQRITDLAHKELEGALVIEGESNFEGSAEEYLTALLGCKEKDDAIERYPHSRILEVILTIAAKHPQYVKKDRSTGRHLEVSIPLFQNNVPGIFKPKYYSYGPGIPKTVQDIYDEMHRLAKNDEGRYEELVQVVGGASSNKLIKGLKSAVHCDPKVMYETYIRRMVFEAEALEAGLCEENPRLLVIKHIYADILGSHLPGIGMEMPIQNIVKIDKEMNDDAD